jgi:hypothetical protein
LKQIDFHCKRYNRGSKKTAPETEKFSNQKPIAKGSPKAATEVQGAPNNADKAFTSRDSTKV